MTEPSRRQFLGALGAGAAGAAGLTRSASAQASPVVEMGNDYFDPIGLAVEPGTTVRFELAAGTHSATAYEDRIPADASPFDSGILSEGSFEHTFEMPGTYDYYCIPHRSVGMVGRIVVGSPGGSAERSPIPDGDVPDSETIVEQGAVTYGAFTDGDGETGGGMVRRGIRSDPQGRGAGPGMMAGGTRSWGGRLPFVGGTLATFGVLGGAVYWALRRDGADGEPDDAAMATLRHRYARGDVDEDELRRRERFEDDGEGRTE